MGVYVAIITTIRQMMLWRMNSAAALKCNDSGSESWLEGKLDRLERSPICECMGQCKLGVWVQCWESRLGKQIFI